MPVILQLEALECGAACLWEAWRAVKKHEHEKTIAELISPIDSTVWDLLPCIGNCGYTPGANAISINAAYAQAPNYRPDMVGLVSLAITFGAQGLVADILAGVFNVLEGGFRVGDIIQTGGFEGVVRDIGVRTTVIESGNQDIKIIENSQIGDVINKTRLTSFVVAELVLSASESLERVEAILETALPDIGRRMDKIISGPVYRGVFEMNGSYPNVKQPAMMLHIEAECRHADVYDVRCYLNRELVLLCEREHIRRL